jgi:uncharacterized protein YqeY
MKNSLKNSLKDAMKARDTAKMDVIRSLLSAIQYEEIQAGVNDLDLAGINTVLKRELKKKHEEIEFAKQANRAEAIDKAQKELSVIESFLPKQMDAAQLEAAVQALKEGTPGANMGVLMKQLKERYDGQYDGKMASEIVKKVLA